MAESYFSAVNYPLSWIIQNVEAGEIALPGIQRPFVWPDAKVRDLFDSMYRGFPVGYLLFAPYDTWRSGTRERALRLLIVDGQQRITSLYSVIKGIPVVRDDFREERIRIAFRPLDGRFEVGNPAIQDDPEFIPDIGPLLSGQVAQYRFVREFLERLSGRRRVDDEEEAKISAAIFRLSELPSYSFTVLQLSRSLDEEQVAEVFMRINSRGVPLSKSDFVLTLVAVSWEEGRRELEDFCRRTRASDGSVDSPFNLLLQPTPDQLLRVVTGLAFRRVRLQAVYSILQGRDAPGPQAEEERKAERFKRLEEAQRTVLSAANWRDFLEVVSSAGYAGRELITSSMALLHCYTLFLIGRHDFQVDDARLRSLMAQWVFTSMLTGRSAGSQDGAVEAHLASLGAVNDADGFVLAIEKMISASVGKNFWKSELPRLMESTSARGAPQIGYYAALNVLGARGLFSDARVADHFEGTRTLARRPLFPRRHLTGSGHSADATQIANYVLADPASGMAGAPRDYYPRLAAAMTPSQLREATHLHALPDGWQDMPYPEFLAARRHAMSAVIREAFERLRDMKPGEVSPAKSVRAKV